MSLRHSPLHRVLHRPNLFLGGERELVMGTALVCGGFTISSLSLGSALMGMTLWLVMLGLYRQMAKYDPMLTRVYLRHIRYQSYYPAHARTNRTR